MTDKQASLEARLRAIEDHLAIAQAICGYGFAMDGCNAEAVGSFYATDGVYAVGEQSFAGRDRISAITSGEIHLGYVRAGCAHVSTPPYIVIDGDKAVATNHTMLVSHREDGFYVARLSASRAELSRKTDGSWQIDHRQMHQLMGDPKGSEMLARLKDSTPLHG